MSRGGICEHDGERSETCGRMSQAKSLISLGKCAGTVATVQGAAECRILTAEAADLTC